MLRAAEVMYGPRGWDSVAHTMDVVTDEYCVLDP